MRASLLLTLLGFAECAEPFHEEIFRRDNSTPLAVQNIAYSIPAPPGGLTLLLGSTAGQPIAITTTPVNATNKNVTWTTQNGLVTITPTGPSTATVVAAAGATLLSDDTITATSVDGGFTASCAVAFTDNAILIDGIQLDDASLVVGDDITIVPHITPGNATNQGLLWDSSDSTVATVDSSGNVHAVKAGTTTITAEANDGSNESATCVVTVTDTPVTGISLNAATLTIVQGDTGTLEATISPAGASDSAVDWSSDNGSVSFSGATHTGDTSTIVCSALVFT